MGSPGTQSATHPSQFQSIVFYVDGGVTLREVREMRKAVEGNEECGDMEILICSSGIVGGEVVDRLFQDVL